MQGRYVGDAGAYAAYPFTPLVDSLCAAVMLPNLYEVRRGPLRGRRGVHEQVPLGGLPRRRLDERPDRPRGPRRRDRARARDRSRWSSGSRTRSRTDSRTSRRPGCKYDGGSYSEAQRKAMELVGLRRASASASGRPEPRAATWASASARSSSRAAGPASSPSGWAFPFDYLDSARVTVEPDGSVVVTLGLHSHGQAHETTMAQVVADKLGGADRERQDRPGGHGSGRVRRGDVR